MVVGQQVERFPPEADSNLLAKPVCVTDRAILHHLQAGAKVGQPDVAVHV